VGQSGQGSIQSSGTSRSEGRVTAGFALYWLAALLVFLPQVVARQGADPDLWGRISVGAVLKQTGHLPVVDDFSYVAQGTRWVDHEWLSGVIFFQVLDKYGEAGLHVFKYSLIAACLLCVFLLHRKVYRARPEISALLSIALAPVALMGFASTLRAQTFSILLALLYTAVLEAIRVERLALRHLAWLIPIAVFWGNAHGGIAMGLLVVAVYGASELALGRPKRAAAHLLAIVAMVVAVALLNPYGPEYMAFLIKSWGLDRTGIPEWRPLLAGGIDSRNVWGALVCGLSLALSLAGAASALRFRIASLAGGVSSNRLPPLAPALLLGLWLVMTLMAHRILPFLVLTLAALAPAFAGLPGVSRLVSWGERPKWLQLETTRIALPATICILAVAALFWVSRSRPLLASIVPTESDVSAPASFAYPDGAVRYLLQSPFEGKLLNPFSQGEFLYWVLYPRFRVAIDGRYEEVYSEEQFWQTYNFYNNHQVRRPKRTIGLANRSGADFILYRTVWRNLAQLSNSPEWRVVYRDDVFVLLARVEVLAAHPDYRPEVWARTSRKGWATIADYLDDVTGRFASYP
jgi:hypothetical protein